MLVIYVKGTLQYLKKVNYINIIKFNFKEI